MRLNFLLILNSLITWTSVSLGQENDLRIARVFLGKSQNELRDMSLSFGCVTVCKTAHFFMEAVNRNSLHFDTS